MATDPSLSAATEKDAAAIAALFVQSWASSRLISFTQLQYGTLDHISLATEMNSRLEKLMKTENVRFVTIRDPSTNEVVAVAQWTLPSQDTNESEQETQEEKDERQRFEDEIRRNGLPESSNKDLIMDFSTGLRELCERVVEGRKYFRLENIVTHPDHRGRGLATKLIKWPFTEADTQNALIYLETASDNPAKRLYEKLGFEEKGYFAIPDLSKYGGEGSQTHLALIRYPNTAA
ncbi:acyl-CoA N-acyltransferase [Lophiotrema nucula]|uniref:Acyl-CoA N-acyltransferase n=1 Tax=Lophiotrema nucula TaxID=690887 RepID=A0A6A5ZAA2_9PLEO|nr:acyl-CoA N-acyltransferase [Lophiotrema nucula]